MSGPATDFRSLVRSIPDFPKPGVLFQDLMPLLADAAAFAQCTDALAQPWLEARVEVVLVIEARGFLFGSALAQRLGAGVVPLRKAGKLPGAVLGEDYQLEYGHERLEMQRGVVAAGRRVLILDDVLATGGTLAAAHRLAHAARLDVLGAAVVVEIAALDGRARWPGPAPVHALLEL